MSGRSSSSNHNSSEMNLSEQDHTHSLNTTTMSSSLSTHNTNHDPYSLSTLSGTSSSFNNNHSQSPALHQNNLHNHSHNHATLHQKAQSERVALFFRRFVHPYIGSTARPYLFHQSNPILPYFKHCRCVDIPCQPILSTHLIKPPSQHMI